MGWYDGSPYLEGAGPRGSEAVNVESKRASVRFAQESESSCQDDVGPEFLYLFTYLRAPFKPLNEVQITVTHW